MATESANMHENEKATNQYDALVQVQTEFFGSSGVGPGDEVEVFDVRYVDRKRSDSSSIERFATCAIERVLRLLSRVAVVVTRTSIYALVFEVFLWHRIWVLATLHCRNDLWRGCRRTSLHRGAR